jgi:hypothetical protein
VSDEHFKAKLYRQCAEELLAVAEGMTDTPQRALLFQIAADYHKLAISLEAPFQPHAAAEPRKLNDPGRSQN